MKKKMEIISNDFYSNCLIEAVKAKVKDWKHIKIIYVSPFDNEVFCPHFFWSDGKYDYDFGIEGMGIGELSTGRYIKVTYVNVVLDLHNGTKLLVKNGLNDSERKG